MSAADIIKALNLAPHPEGGYFRRTHKTSTEPNGRGQMTAIYYLLEGTDFARWHRIDSDELWLWHAGSPMTLEIQEAGNAMATNILGNNILAGEHPQILVPAHAWQRVRSNRDWSLVSCAVSPGFLFDTLEMATDELNLANN
ncbi:cupin domain-containing protein [Kordiimonas pumila]|uniref:Cupin domain-containing protein n=1 Tax=Kordiimonas pumila TaxID=2161677 RepID=A0ABV7D8Q5_9PROT|nr:cupin domain-containing protein [Kordiimonas pumila]